MYCCPTNRPLERSDDIKYLNFGNSTPVSSYENDLHSPDMSIRKFSTFLLRTFRQHICHNAALITPYILRTYLDTGSLHNLPVILLKLRPNYGHKTRFILFCGQ